MIRRDFPKMSILKWIPHDWRNKCVNLIAHKEILQNSIFFSFKLSLFMCKQRLGLRSVACNSAYFIVIRLL